MLLERELSHRFVSLGSQPDKHARDSIRHGPDTEDRRRQISLLLFLVKEFHVTSQSLARSP